MQAHSDPQVGKTLYPFLSKEPSPENNADRKSELFAALFAQLFAQLLAQLDADPLSLLNTQDDTAKQPRRQLHTAMQPIPGFGREPVFVKLFIQNV